MILTRSPNCAGADDIPRIFIGWKKTSPAKRPARPAPTFLNTSMRSIATITIVPIASIFGIMYFPRFWDGYVPGLAKVSVDMVGMAWGNRWRSVSRNDPPRISKAKMWLYYPNSILPAGKKWRSLARVLPVWRQPAISPCLDIRSRYMKCILGRAG